MRFLFILSFKNLSRYKRRTIITSLSIAVGIAIYIFLNSWLLGIENESERNLVWYETSSARIINKIYWEEKDHLPLKYTIQNSFDLESLLKKDGFSYTKRIAFGGELFFGEGSTQVKFFGIDPETDQNVFRLKKTIIEGEWFKPGEPKAIIGEWLAEDLGIVIGDIIIIRTKTRFGSFQTLELEVAGIINCPNPLINKNTGFIPISVVDDALQMQKEVTEIDVYFSNWKKPESRTEVLSNIIGSDFPDLMAVSWKDLAQDYIMFANLKSGATNIILLLVFIIAAVGVSNTVLNAVFERIREIGMMRALGMKDSWIRLSFLLESGGIGLIGSILGVILGSGLTFFIVRWGIDYSNLIGHMDIGYRVTGVFRGEWDLKTMISAFVAGALASMLISIIPSSRALKMSITESLRYQ